MTFEELKAYTDALIDSTGDENLKRVRKKMEEVGPVFAPKPPGTFWDYTPYIAPASSPGWPTVTCGKANFDPDPNIRVWNA